MGRQKRKRPLINEQTSTTTGTYAKVAYRPLTMKKLESQLVHRVLATAQEFARGAVPQIQSAPVWFVYEILVAAGMGIGQENRDLLLSPANKHPESPRGRLRVINFKGAPRDPTTPFLRW